MWLKITVDKLLGIHEDPRLGEECLATPIADELLRGGQSHNPAVREAAEGGLTYYTQERCAAQNRRGERRSGRTKERENRSETVERPAVE